MWNKNLTIEESFAAGVLNCIDPVWNNTEVVFNDTFTEGSDTALGSHTPDVGTGWTVSVGSIDVVASSDVARGTSTFSGHRANTDNLSVINYSVSLEVVTLPAGTYVFAGPRARFGSSSATTGGLEFTYDRGIGGWTLDDTTSSASWPGDGTYMMLEVIGSTAIGYTSPNGTDDSWTQVINDTSFTDSSSYGHFAGILGGEFDGGSLPELDNFVVRINASASDSCTYSGSGDWVVDMTDNCVITTDYDVIGRINFTGASGTATFNSSSINTTGLDNPPSNTFMYVGSNLMMMVGP